jgi:hypothetical protein
MHNINPLKTQLNPICHLLALLWAHHILHVSRIRVNLPNTRSHKLHLLHSQIDCCLISKTNNLKYLTYGRHFQLRLYMILKSVLLWCHVLLLLFFFQLRTAALRFIVRSWLDAPTFATRRLHACHHARAPSGRRWNCGREMSGNFA